MCDPAARNLPQHADSPEPRAGHSLTLAEIDEWVCREMRARPRWAEHVRHHDAMAIVCAALHDLGHPSPNPRPTDEELLKVQDEAVAAFPPRHPDADPLTAVEYARELEIRKARAVLFRWGSFGVERCHRLQQENHRFREPERTILCDILANGTLLPDPRGVRYGHQPPQPIPLSERLPGPEDCDADGFIWCGYPWTYNDANERESYAQWMLVPKDSLSEHGSHWLPYHALPLPTGANMGNSRSERGTPQ